MDGVQDHIDYAYGTDYNRNGVPDHHESYGGYGYHGDDANANGIPDHHEQGYYGDYNMDGVQDHIEGGYYGYGYTSDSN